MCVIAYIPKEAKEINRDILEKMWSCNPHGAGIMWLNNNHQVGFSKGYFYFEDFYRDYLIIKRDYNYECAIHFRIATSGGISRTMCHPFALTNSIPKIMNTSGASDVLVMHNGIIKIDTAEHLNDTCMYIINKLYPRYKKNRRFFTDKKQEEIIKNEIGYSKLCFLSSDGVKLIGNWSKYKDCYFSNLYFMEMEYV